MNGEKQKRTHIYLYICTQSQSSDSWHKKHVKGKTFPTINHRFPRGNTHKIWRNNKAYMPFYRHKKLCYLKWKKYYVSCCYSIVVAIKWRTTKFTANVRVSVKNRIFTKSSYKFGATNLKNVHIKLFLYLWEINLYCNVRLADWMITPSVKLNTLFLKHKNKVKSDIW